jgi:hypothetical protein
MKVRSVTRYLTLGLLIFVTACSPLVVIVQPTSGGPSPPAQLTQDKNAIYTAAAQTIQAQMPTQYAAPATPVPATATQIAVELPSATSALVARKVTAASIDIELEQGSGTACTADSTYFIHAHITAGGPTTAYYEIGSTAGQIAAGNFQNNGLIPYVTGIVVFDQEDTKTINLRFVGPYPYPDHITVNLRVNGGEWHNTKLSCQ